ncbi:restriction endonuclease subunit S, partial [Capnocytophaga canimorsus]|uniref:restriction endonuclease subunit S n=1 Tax=Capnocytophaga canimorsus TaxID=28188 RepID=UPI0037D43FCA
SPYRKYTEHFADGTAKNISEEIPFEIPENWAWCRLGEVGRTVQYGVSKSAKSEGLYKLLRITDIQENKVIWENVPFTDIEEEEAESFVLENGDFLFARTGATVGKSYLVENLMQKSVFASYLIRISLLPNNNINYIKYFFNSEYYWQQISEKSVGIGQPNVNGTSLKELFLPLPPLSEQQHIVSKVEELLALVEDLETNKTDLKSTIQQTKAKVLDMAIRGELVPQNPDDEPASVLLERIKNEQQSAKSKKKNTVHNTHYDNDKLLMVNDEFPFEIPENWAWCRLGEIGEVIMGQSPKSENISGKGNLEFHQGKIFFTSKYIKPSNFYTNEITKVAPANSVLICVRAPVGEVNITNRRLCIGRGLCCIVPLQRMSEKFIYYWTKTLKRKFIQKATGSTFSSISMDVIKNEIVPLPPLSEQKRIVQKIEEIFTELDTIEENLT